MKELGLTEYEAKALLGLFEFGSLKPRKVAFHSGIPPARVYDTLRSLASKKLVVQLRSDPLIFKAVDPEIGLSALVKRKEKHLEFLKSSAIKQVKSLKRVVPFKEKERIVISAGPEQRFSHSYELTSALLKEKTIISVSDRLPVKTMKANVTALKRGARIRLITTKFNKENRQVIENYIKNGIPVRFSSELKGMNLVTFDRKASLIIIYDPEDQNRTINLRINLPSLAKAHAEYFEHAWKRAKPIKL